MNYTLLAILQSAGLFAGMVLVSEVARWLTRRHARTDDGAEAVAGPVIGAVLALLGLLIAFNFHGAQARFDARRGLIVEEANAIGTAWLRLDLLPEGGAPSLRDALRRYAASRAALYEKLDDAEAARAEVAVAAALQRDIWSEAIEATSAPEAQPARVLLLPALNQMFDLATARTQAIQTHPPAAISVLLFTLALGCAGLIGSRAGRGAAGRGRYGLVFALVTALVLYLILDLEYPRYGVVRLEQVNRVLVDVAASLQ